MTFGMPQMRKRFKTSLLLVIMIFSSLFIWGRENLKPNILVILVDDVGYGDLGCYGSRTIRTPHLDRLAREGSRFTSFYSHPLCGPTRSALMTGRYPARSGGWGMPATEITIAERIKTAGYVTACVGK
jgi:arylsulfatase A-like enzyme